MLKKLSFAAFGLAFSASASAVFIPPPGPLVINFNNSEQISPTNSIVAPSGASEGNWGVAKVNTIYLGLTPIPANQLFGTTGSPVFSDSNSGQITAMFYGVQTVAPGCAGCLDAAGGSLELWWENPSAGGTFADLGTAVPGDRTGDNAFTNFTDGTFLAKIDFASGIDPANSGIDIRGTVVPSSSGFLGTADSFGNVDVAAGGAWADLLNQDFFNTPFGTRDVRFRNVYNDQVSWDGGQDVFGATSSDPARAYVPEPGSIFLVALGLLGMGLVRRRVTQQ